MKVYLIHHQLAYQNNFDKEVEEIKKIVPDKVLLFCQEEGDPGFIFKDLFPKLSPWLTENNKFAKIITSVSNGQILYPNFITEKSYGLQLLIERQMRGVQSLNLDLDNVHLKAKKLYTCYNYTPKYHRAITLDMLARENLLDDGVITFHKPEIIQHDYESYGGKCFSWKYYNGQILRDEQEFTSDLTKLFDVVNFMPKSFLDGFLDIVTETQYLHGQHFLTEKTCKSLIMQKPFLCVASPGFHSYLKEEYGIQPYTELFDYSFDWEDNIVDRVEGVVKNLLRLKLMSIQERNIIHDRILIKMKENKKRLYNYSFNKEKMIPASLKFITTEKNYTLHGHVETCYTMFQYYKKLNWIKE